jgi:hypothetical protein
VAADYRDHWCCGDHRGRRGHGLHGRQPRRNSAFTTCDPGWTSLIATPPHPDYVAGHPAFSGAGATVLAAFFGTDNIGFTSTSDTYCNFGTPMLDANGSITGCTVSGSDVPVTQCNDVPSGGTLFNNSPLICPITEQFSSFSEASSGPSGATFSRVAGGIHTPFAVNDALLLGDLIGADDFANNLQFVPEPATSLLLVPGLSGLLLSRRWLGLTPPVARSFSSSIQGAAKVDYTGSRARDLSGARKRRRRRILRTAGCDSGTSSRWRKN